MLSVNSRTGQYIGILWQQVLGDLGWRNKILKADGSLLKQKDDKVWIDQSLSTGK